MTRISEQDRERLKLFVTEMKEWRAAKGWTQRELAAECQYSTSLIAQAEIYERTPTLGLAKALDRAFRTPGYTPPKPPDPGKPGTFQRILKQIGRIAIPAAFRRFAEELRQRPVRTIYWSEHSYVPGILQTPDYARAVLERGPNITEDAVNARMEERVSIQDLLTRTEPAPPVLWVVMDEHILERNFGGPEVMHNQGLHLVEMASRPNVTIHVISGSEGHPGLNGAFVIAEMATGESIAHVDSATLVQMTDDPDSIGDLKLRFDSQRIEAYRGTESLDRLQMAVDRWKQ